jgi:hypothetical protein
MSEVIRKGIEEASHELEKENQEKLEHEVWCQDVTLLSGKPCSFHNRRCDWLKSVGPNIWKKACITTKFWDFYGSCSVLLCSTRHI